MTPSEPEHKDTAPKENRRPVKSAEETREVKEPEQLETTTVTLVPVSFRNDRPSVHCDAGGLMVDEGEWVVVPCEQCSEVGQVSGLPVRIQIPANCDIPKIERLATTREIELYYQNIESEKNARRVCQDRIEALGLQMKLVRVESLFDGSKIIFFYSADGRVDFRELVKELVRALRTRVEMCQIGIRHEAKMTGGIGSCGRVLCCTSFLKSFDPVSIKMAKVQNLPLNPNKISGFCGRLLCCLTFEYDTYREYAKHLPSMGNMCDSPSGEGKVVRRNILKRTVSLATEQNGVVEFSNQELEDFKMRKEQGLPPLSKKQVDHEPKSSSEEKKPQPSSRGRQKATEKKKKGRQTGKSSVKQKAQKKEARGQKAPDRKKAPDRGKPPEGKKNIDKKKTRATRKDDSRKTQAKADGGKGSGRGKRRGGRRRGKQARKQSPAKGKS